MHKINFIILILLFSKTTITAQDSINITGVVKDVYSKQHLPFANILVNGTYVGTATDIFGKYRLKISKDRLPIDLKISYMGYELQTNPIFMDRKAKNTGRSFIFFFIGVKIKGQPNICIVKICSNLYTIKTI